MSVYKNTDVGNDSVWDVWELESPRISACSHLGEHSGQGVAIPVLWG